MMHLMEKIHVLHKLHSDMSYSAVGCILSNIMINQQYQRRCL